MRLKLLLLANPARLLHWIRLQQQVVMTAIKPLKKIHVTLMNERTLMKKKILMKKKLMQLFLSVRARFMSWESTIRMLMSLPG